MMQIASHAMNLAEDWLIVPMVRNLLSMLTGKGGCRGWERDGCVRRESGCIWIDM